MERRRYVSVIALLFLLSLAWLFWSGIYKPILLWLGVFSCLLSLFLAHRIGFFNVATGLHVAPKLPGYWLWLLKEVAKSSYDVSKIVLSPSLPIQPTLVKLEAEPKGAIGQVILSNAITLSPGTVTLDLHQDQLQVHCLTESGAAGLVDANRITAQLTDK